ncbi:MULTISPECIES: GNAT family N-acetyltransferase [Chitinophagaceae]|uniref:GNAT family N-acetyltransferase n=1 Tax=Chitinophagaceae TaxID=563835 RepID=UPI000DEF667A|nr:MULTISPECIES: GNAT family N-acetyltransferase [Chitinophagaceae]RPD48153.1 GNAT family N-acetyltransferase [Paracnuella aquatica]
MNFSIREATVQDAALVADLSRQTFYDTFAVHNTAANMQQFLDQQFTRGRLMLEVGRPGNIFLLAYFNDEVAGYVKLRETHTPAALVGTPSLEIARLYACEQFIGKGVGNLLMQKSIDLGRQTGKKLVWLCVWEKNERAIRFYQRWGFTRFGDIDFILGQDVQNDWMMKRDI